MLLPDEKARPQSESLAPVAVHLPAPLIIPTDPPRIILATPPTTSPTSPVTLRRAASSLRIGIKERTPFRHRTRMVAILTTLLFILPSVVISGVVVSVLADDTTLAPYSVAPFLTIPHHIVCVVKMYLHHRKRKALPLPRFMTSKFHIIGLFVLAFSWLPIAIYMTIVNTRQLTKNDGDDVVERNTESFIPAVLAFVELAVLLAMATVFMRVRRALRPEIKALDPPPRRTFPTSIAYLAILFPSLLVSVSALVLLAVSVSTLVAIPAASVIHHFVILFAHLRHYRYSPPTKQRGIRSPTRRLPHDAAVPPMDTEGLPATYPPFFTSYFNILLLLVFILAWIALVIVDLFFYVMVRSSQWHFVSGHYVPPVPNRPQWTGQGPPEMFIAAVSLATIAAVLTCVLFRLFFLARFDPVLSGNRIGGDKKDSGYVSDDEEDEEQGMHQVLPSPTVSSAPATGTRSSYSGLGSGLGVGWSAMRSTSSLTPPGLMGLDLPPPAYTPVLGPGRSEGVSVTGGGVRIASVNGGGGSSGGQRIRTRLRRAESPRGGRRSREMDEERRARRSSGGDGERRVRGDDSESQRTLRATVVVTPEESESHSHRSRRSLIPSVSQSIPRTGATLAGSSIARRGDVGGNG